MFKPEFVRKLKKNNISTNAKKTMERVKEVWRSLNSAERVEVLTFADIKKISVERAYKTGGISAKIAIALAQMLDIDPRYFTGEVNEKGNFDSAVAAKILHDLGYDTGKADITKGKKAEAKPAKAPVAANKAPEQPVEKAPQDISVISVELAKLLSKDTNSTLNELKEEDIILLLKSLSVQAEFSEEKKKRLALVKGLLLL